MDDREASKELGERLLRLTYDFVGTHKISPLAVITALSATLVTAAHDAARPGKFERLMLKVASEMLECAYCAEEEFAKAIATTAVEQAKKAPQ
jgi:hypothetical protein